MSKRSEGTNAQNIANLNTLLSYLNSLGSKYQPSNPAIQLNALHEQFRIINQVQNSFKEFHNSYSKCVDEQALEFEDLKKLAVRIENNFKSSGVSPAAIKTLQSITRKLKGARSKKIEDTPEATAENNVYISVSQQSHANLISHFESLLLWLRSEASYNPNEADLKLEALQVKLDALKNAFKSVGLIEGPLKTARLERNQALYNTTNGLITTIRQVKAYVKSIYSAQSPEVKQLTAIRFTNRVI